MMTLIFIRWSVWSDDDQVMIISRHTTVTSSFARPICQPDATGSCLLSKNSQSSYITTCKHHQTEKKWIILWLQNRKIHNETLEGVVYNIHFHPACNHYDWRIPQWQIMWFDTNSFDLFNFCSVFSRLPTKVQAQRQAEQFWRVQGKTRRTIKH